MNTTLTVEQQKRRIGKFCASEIHKIMCKKGLGQTGLTYIIEKVAEFITGEKAQPEFTSAATQWGINHQLEAQLYYEAATGEKIITVDTIDTELLTGTPDGLIENRRCGIEIKCPYNSGNHVKYMLLNNQEDLKEQFQEYYWQIVSYMHLTGYSDWKFCSYDPRFSENKMFILNIKENIEDIQLLKERLTESKKIFDEIIKSIRK